MPGKNAVYKGLLAKTAVVLIAATLLFALKAYASSSEIVVNICGLTQPLRLDVKQPKSDTLVNRPNILIKGVATQQAQLDIYLNNQLNNTFSTNSDGSFAAGLTLLSGTNTIKITGASFCGGTTSDAAIILTYAPSSRAGSGLTTQIPGINSQNLNQGNLNDKVSQIYDILVLLLLVGGIGAIILGLIKRKHRQQNDSAKRSWYLLTLGIVSIIAALLLLVLSLR